MRPLRIVANCCVVCSLSCFRRDFFGRLRSGVSPPLHQLFPATMTGVRPLPAFEIKGPNYRSRPKAAYRSKANLTSPELMVGALNWLGTPESGPAKRLSDVAALIGMDRAYVSRIVNLTILAPDIVVAILDEALPDHVTLFDLASGTPLSWDEQRAAMHVTNSVGEMNGAFAS